MGSVFLNTTAAPSSSTISKNVKGVNSSSTATLISPMTTLSPEQMKIDYYKTYDLMTGIRIAATLGGFFVFMVLLLVYKSKCKSKSLSKEDLNAAVAAAVAAEEEKENISAMEFYSSGLDRAREPRRSLGNMSTPIFTHGRSRFLSIGGYSTLGTPLCLHYQRGKSLPGSALRFPFYINENEGEENGQTSAYTNQFAEEDIDREDDPIMENPCYHNFLTVPVDHRRLSSITCSSSDTSYLERRGSAMELGIPVPPPFTYKMKRKDSEFENPMLEETWDFYYPIDIQVIQPTPEMSPCGSEHTLYDHTMDISQTLRPMSSLAISSTSLLSVPKMAPLASISSCAASLSDYPDFDSHSVGSDSVFMDDDELDEMDTEDDVDGFSTDSDEQSHIPFSQHFMQARISTSYKPAAGRWGITGAGYQPKRRVSAPTCHDRKKKSTCVTISAKVDAGKNISRPSDMTDVPSCSRSCDQIGEDLNVPYNLSRRPPLPLPSDSSSSESTMHKSSGDKEKIQVSPTTGTSLSCDQIDRLSASPREKLLALPSFPLLVKGSCEHLAKVLASKDSTPVNENCTWSQETLF